MTIVIEIAAGHDLIARTRIINNADGGGQSRRLSSGARVICKT